MRIPVSQIHGRWGTIALVGITAWPIIVVGLHLYRGTSYDPVVSAISELALGPAGFLMNLAFVLMGIGCFALAQGLRLSVRDGRAGSLLLTVASILAFVSAIFHTNAHGTPATTTSKIHDNAGLVSFLLIIVAMYLYSWRFSRDQRWRTLSIPTLCWSLIATGTFFLVPALGPDRFGLAQRIFVTTWISWMIVVSVRLSALERAALSSDLQVESV